MYKQAAIDIFLKSTTPSGFLATAQGKENYDRVWSRDSAITALALFLTGATDCYPTIKQSILTLAEQQLENGLIPSNVKEGESTKKQVSYGTLVGRVDAQTWWIIQSCLYLKVVSDEALKTYLKPKLLKTLALLDAWEFNARHLIYTPLGGNWADEYMLSGYTLYDNCLRYLSLHLFLEVWPEQQDLSSKKQQVYKALQVNFTAQNEPLELQIHARAKNEWLAGSPNFFPAAFDAAQYAPFWDAAANGLALLIGLDNKGIHRYLENVLADEQTKNVPAFWPVIRPAEPAWKLLEQQYNYEFKNVPFHFHNGGSWPVMTGILSLGLTASGQQFVATQLSKHYEQFLVETDQFAFSEYIAINEQKPGGKKAMCFSAAGYLLMQITPQQISTLLNL